MKKLIFTTLLFFLVINLTFAQVITDIDGNIYHTVTIGTQTWMVENLKTTHYRNGSPIPQITDPTQWANLTSGAWCYYNNDPANEALYGKLYNWYAVNDVRGLAPQGWTVPSDTNWTALTNFLGGESIAGGKMKATVSWSTPNTGATNESGFTCLASGIRFYNGSFGNMGLYSFLWSSTEDVAGGAWHRSLSYNDDTIFRTNLYEPLGISVRCIEDIEQNAWTQKTSLSGPERSQAMSFVINGKAYVGLGTCGSGCYYTDFWMYDAANDNWTQKATFPAPHRQQNVGFSINGKGYILCGISDVAHYSELWEYDPNTDSWSQKSSYPGRALRLMVAFTIGNKAYAGIGEAADTDPLLTNEFWEYDPSNDQWTQKASFAGGDRSEMASFAIDNYGYVIGGNDYIQNRKDVWQYTPSTDSWTLKDSLPVHMALGVGFAIGNKGYVGTGIDTTAIGLSQHFYEYNSLKDSWTQVADLPGEPRSFAIGFAIGNKGYVTTGYGSYSTALKDLWQYSPSSISTNTFVEPKIYITKGALNVGQTLTITGKDFTINEKAKLNISGPDGFSQNNTLAVISNGSFVYAFASNTSMPAGIYNVSATDSVSGNSSSVKTFKLTNTTPVTGYLKITSPAINISSKINSSIKIEWTDKPSHISTLIPNTSVVHAQYKVEYNRDNTGWQLIEIKTYPAFYQQVSTFPYNYTPTQTGTYRFRVTDMQDAANTDMSAIVTVNNDPSAVVINYAWDYSGNRPTETPLGVAADGTARIYVKISKKTGNNKTISNVALTVRDSSNLSITNTSLLGKVYKATPTILYNVEANDATSISASSNIVAFDGAVWFWYVAPEDFPRDNNDNFLSTRYLNLVATVTYSDNSTDPVSEKAEIVRAPLMFVHGIGGDETTWDDFYYSMNGTPRYFTRETDSRWKFRRALNMYPGGSYKQNAQLLLTLTNSGFKINADATESYNSNSFQFFLQQMRNKRYSCNRVDYIAHSMGGDMARTAINYYSSEYKPDVSAQRKFKNYGNGFINKLITLNTPHNGSPWADLTIENLSQNYAVQKLLQGGNDYSSNGYLIRSIFNTVSGSDQLDFNNPTEALKNLRFGINGVKFRVSDVKNHLISGDVAFGGEDCLGIYNELKKDENIGLVVKMFAAIGANECIGVDDLFVPYGVTDYVENSDFVVPLASELPGKNLSSSGNDYSIYYGFNTNHLSIHNSDKNPAVGQKVFDLLNAPINSVNFADNIAANNSPGSEVYRPALVNSISEYIDTSKIFIVQPVRGSSFTVDSSVVIFIKLKDTTNFKFLNLLFQNNIYTSSSNTDLQSFNVQVNPNFVNNQTIVATAVYDSAGTNIYYTDTLSVNIQIDSLINGFFVTSDIKYLNSSETYAPSYNLIHNTYISNVSISDTTLHIAIADTNVVTYSKSISNFIAKDTGTTYAIISFKQFKDTLFFIIDTATLNLIALPVDLTSFTGQVEKEFNLLEWKAGDGLYSHFILQKSISGQQWVQVTRVNSLPGSSLNTYSFRDSSSIKESLVYYRLLLINRDGTYKISNTVLLRRGNTISGIRVFPNPVTKKEVFVDLGSFAPSKVIISVIDMSGKTVKKFNTTLQYSNPIRLDLSGLKPSIYVLQIQQGSDMKTIKLVVLE